MPPLLTDAQLRAELERCQSCEAKPCRSGCPAGLSPADFILAARCGEPSDYRRAAAHILALNPLGGVCGQVCPDTLCMASCSRRALDGPVRIPEIQAAIVRRARQLGAPPRSEPPPATGQRVAVVGAGPAGIGAAAVLARAGHTVHLFDRASEPGGMTRLIPRDRLDRGLLAGDLDGLRDLGDLKLLLDDPVTLPRDLLARGYGAVVVAAGLSEPVELDVPGKELGLPWTRLLGSRPPRLRGRRVAIVGDGAVAIDCANAARARGAAHVELLALKSLSELGTTPRERERLFAPGVHVSCRVRVAAIRGRGRGRGARVTGLLLRKVELPEGETFHPSRLVELPHGAKERRDFDAVVVAVGGRAGLRREPHPRIVHAGDLETGPSSVVEALASGKRAGLSAHRLIAGDDVATCPDRGSCPEGGGACPKRATCPEWNRPASSGGTASAPNATGLPVALDCSVLGRRLRSPFLLAPSPFTVGYAQVTRAFEAGWAGAVMKCAVGGDADGHGDAADRLCLDVERLARDFPDRLTLVALDRPEPGADDGEKLAWRELARRLEAAGAMTVRSDHPLCVDPGLTDYRAAAVLLARGAQAVPIDALVRRHGLGIIGELQAGLSWSLAERSLRSVSELAGGGRARPASASEGSVAAADAQLCTKCGNCTRCPYLAIALDAGGIPTVDAVRCTGCGLCVEQCFTGAMGLPSRVMRIPPVSVGGVPA